MPVRFVFAAIDLFKPCAGKDISILPLSNVLCKKYRANKNEIVSCFISTPVARLHTVPHPEVHGPAVFLNAE